MKNFSESIEKIIEDEIPIAKKLRVYIKNQNNMTLRVNLDLKKKLIINN
ncbi:hypothetical protein [Candidatus Pelagibacter sp. HIMB1593]